jgi:ribosome biogenesis GTPase
MDLTTYGWNAERQAEFASDAANGLTPGRVVREHRSHFQVVTRSGEVSAETAGRLRNTATLRSDLAGIGDFVALRTPAGDGPSTIERTLPRITALIRTASGEKRPQLLAANVDVVFIVTAPDGDLNLPRMERFLELVAASGAAPVIVLNKADLVANAEGVVSQLNDVAPSVPVHMISARHGQGTAILEQYFGGASTICLIGSSGVGKSTLTNALLSHAVQATQDVRAHDSRGRHTTTDRRLFLRPQGGSIIDSPGIRGVVAWNPADIEKSDNFDDVEAVARSCKFRDCRHENEPKCAVRSALQSGTLTAERVALFAARHATRSVPASSRSNPGDSDRLNALSR